MSEIKQNRSTIHTSKYGFTLNHHCSSHQIHQAMTLQTHSFPESTKIFHHEFSHVFSQNISTINHLIKQLFTCSCEKKYYFQNYENSLFDTIFSEVDDSHKSTNHKPDICQVIQTTIVSPSCLRVYVPLVDCAHVLQNCVKDSKCK